MGSQFSNGATNRAVDIVRFEGEFALIGEGIEKEIDCSNQDYQV